MCPATRRPGVQPGLVHEPCSISLMLFWLVLTNARACNLKARLYVRFLAIFPRSSSSLLFLFEVSTPQVQDHYLSRAELSKIWSGNYYPECRDADISGQVLTPSASRAA